MTLSAPYGGTSPKGRGFAASQKGAFYEENFRFQESTDDLSHRMAGCCHRIIFFRLVYDSPHHTIRSAYTGYCLHLLARRIAFLCCHDDSDSRSFHESTDHLAGDPIQDSSDLLFSLQHFVYPCSCFFGI